MMISLNEHICPNFLGGKRILSKNNRQGNCFVFRCIFQHTTQYDKNDDDDDCWPKHRRTFYNYKHTNRKQKNSTTKSTNKIGFVILNYIVSISLYIVVCDWEPSELTNRFLIGFVFVAIEHVYMCTTTLTNKSNVNGIISKNVGQAKTLMIVISVCI